eukprot:m.258891 g.258891  ORF g.258891 m.258891 type:complete len:740 (-) comp37243_c0_seq1:101-2320(-)
MHSTDMKKTQSQMGSPKNAMHSMNQTSMLEHAARVVLEERLGEGEAQSHMVTKVLQDIGAYWRNGNPVAIEIFLRESTEQTVEDPRRTPTQHEAVVEVWDLELRSLIHDANEIPDDEVDEVKIQEMQNLMILALRSFLHFSPLNAWILQNKRVREHLWCRVSSPPNSEICSRMHGHGSRSFKPLQLPHQQSELMLSVSFQQQQPSLPWFDFQPHAGDENEAAQFLSPTKSHVAVVCGAKRDRNSPSVHSPQPTKPNMRPRLDTLVVHHEPCSGSGEHGAPTKLNALRPSNLFGRMKDIHGDDDDHDMNDVVHMSDGEHKRTSTIRQLGKRPKPEVATFFHKGTGLPLASSPDPRKRQMMFERQMHMGVGQDQACRTMSAPIPIKSYRTGGIGASSLTPKGVEWDSAHSNTSSINCSTSGPRRPSFAHGRITDSPPHKGLQLAHSMISPPFTSTPGLHRPRVNSLDRQFGIGAKRLLGSYEESLLSGRMNNWASSSVKGFVAELGACGAGKTPPHVRLALPASFYKIPGESSSSAPYVGTLDLANAEARRQHKSLKNGRYRVPPNGLVQLMIYNPQKTGVKVFLVKYDFREMPSKTRTFLRQSTYLEIPSSRRAPSSMSGSCSSQPPRRKQLLYAIHLRFVCTKPGRIYLDKDIRVVFSHRAPDLNDKVTTVTEGPKNPMFSPIKADGVGGNSGVGSANMKQKHSHLSDDDDVKLHHGGSLRHRLASDPLFRLQRLQLEA